MGPVGNNVNDVQQWLYQRQGWNPDGTHTVGGVTFDANGRPTDPNNPYSLNYNGTPWSADQLAAYHQISNAEAYGTPKGGAMPYNYFGGGTGFYPPAMPP